MAKYSGLINIVIILAVLYVVFKTGLLNSVISGLKGVGNQISGSVNQMQGIANDGGQTQRNEIRQTSDGETSSIDVQGNGCACTSQNGNTVCKGNCSNGAMIDPNDFDPFEFVRQNS